MKKLSTESAFNSLQAKILPLRLYVDQDAIDFLKKFFSFKDSNAQASERISNDGEAYIRTICLS